MPNHDPLDDARTLRNALRKGPLGLSEAALLLAGRDDSLTPEAQEATLRAVERAVAIAAERGWIERHHGLLHVTNAA